MKGRPLQGQYSVFVLSLLLSLVTAMSLSWGSANTPQDEHLCHAPGHSATTKDLTRGDKKRPLLHTDKNEAEEHDLSDEFCYAEDKKRRLTTEQVNFLETSFHADLKLEPERKARIAKQLGIRPRQVAIWFQNRRARWKNKQLEQDYEALKASYEAVVKEKERFLKEHELALERKKALVSEVSCLTSLLQSQENSSISDAIVVGSWVSKEEPISSKSDLMSPTKSVVDQSEVQDSGQSMTILSDPNELITIDPPVKEINPAYVQGLPVDNMFGSLPLMVQQLLVYGYSLEDAYHTFLEWEDQLGWHDVGGGHHSH